MLFSVGGKYQPAEMLKLPGGFAMESLNIVKVNCNQCGATLEVGEQTRFVTCQYCQSRLAIQRNESAVFSEVLEKIDTKAGQIVDNLKMIQLQNELQQLDREWSMFHENLMDSGKHGSKSEPSIAGGLIAIIMGVVFGGFWTVTAANMRAPIIFPLFGIFFIGVCLFMGFKSINNAGQLQDKRKEYEMRRQKLLDAIRVEKQQ